MSESVDIATAEAAKPPLSAAERLAEAHRLVRSNAWWSAGAGLIPIPALDLATVAGVQINLIYRLGELYGVPFQRERVKAIIGGLVGGGVPYALSTGALGMVAKSIPFVGSVVGMALMPALAGAATLALGRVFISHFEAGGTLLDFDPDEMRGFFLKEFEAAKTETGAVGGAKGGGKAARAEASAG